MPMNRKPRVLRAAGKTKVKKAPNGAKIKIDGRDKSGLSLTEFKQIKKMLPKVEVKLAPVKNLVHTSVPYQISTVLPNLPIIGTSICGSASLVYGVDKIRQGTNSGERIGDKISVKKVDAHFQWCIDDPNTDASIDPGPYQIRWFIYRVKGTIDAMGEGGLPLNINGNWKAMYDTGNSVYTAPTGRVVDMFNKINSSIYTVYKQGTFVLQTTQRKTEPDGAYLTQPMIQSDSKGFKHVHLDLTKYVAKTLKYEDDPVNPTNQPVNDALFMTYNIVKYDNQPIDGNLLVNCTSTVSMWYTDS